MKNAFALIHFGSNIKYFELELYFILMLKQNTKYDCIYLYSLTDTPPEWAEIMKSYFDKVIGFNDENITTGAYDSKYKHFNTLRTCDYIFAYNLIEYSRICIVESDMVILENLDKIFNYKCPAVLFVNLNKTAINSNNAIIMKNKNKNIDCSKGSIVNGGILLFKPSKDKFNFALTAIKQVIEDNCAYPNEELFLAVEQHFNKHIYNMPILYNYCHYNLTEKKNTGSIKIVHFNETKYKHLDIIRDGFNNKFKEKKVIVEFFKQNYYNKYHDLIDQILKLSINNK